MYHIELINEYDHKTYNNQNDILQLLQYIMRFSKTGFDSYRIDNPYLEYTGCEPFIFPRYYEHDPDAVFQYMLINNRAFGQIGKNLMLHRVVSFSITDYILPSDLIPLAHQIIMFYAKSGYIAAFGIHRDTCCCHLHVAVNTPSYIDGHRFSIKHEHEYQTLIQMTDQWYRQHERKLENPMIRTRYEEILFGKCDHYGQIALSAREQMKINRLNHSENVTEIRKSRPVNLKVSKVL